MKNVINAEFYYLLKSNKLWIYIAIYVICSVVNVIMGGSPKLDLALFVLTTLVVSELMHKDSDAATLKNIAGSGIKYKNIFRAKCWTAMLICGAMLIVSTVSGIIYQMIKDPEAIDKTAILLSFLTKLANYLIILVIGEFTNSIGGTIILSILITGGLPMALDFMSMNDNVIGRIASKIYPYTLGGLSGEPLKTALPKFGMIVAVIIVLVILSEKHYVKKHYG